MLGRTLAQFKETILIRPDRVALIFQVNTVGRRFGANNVSPDARTFFFSVRNRADDAVTLVLKQAAATRPITDYSQEIGHVLTTEPVNAVYPIGNGAQAGAASDDEVMIVKGGWRTFSVVLDPGNNLLIVEGKDGSTAGLTLFEVGAEQDNTLAFVSPGNDRFGEQTFLDGSDAYGSGIISSLNTGNVEASYIGDGTLGPTSIEFGSIGGSAIRYAVSLRGTWTTAAAAIQYYGGVDESDVAIWHDFLDEAGDPLSFTGDHHDTYIAPLGKIRVVLTSANATTEISAIATPVEN